MDYQPNDYGSLRYVDRVGNHYLFRGGAPLTSVRDPNNPRNCIPDPNNPDKCLQVFDYAGLTKAIASAPNVPSVPPPPATQYYLVIIDLVHSNEASEIEPALSYFNDPENPSRTSQGQANLWDTNGTAVCYFNTPQDQRAKLVTTIEQWLGDPLVWRVATIRSWLEDATQVPSGRPGVPIVIYVHCDGGCDRTGEMIGAYRLRYMNGAWAEVWGDQPCGRPLGCDNYRALQWYAFWLNQTQGFKLHYIGLDGGCTDQVIHRICSRPDEVPIFPPVD
jgi:hypothetical protein